MKLLKEVNPETFLKLKGYEIKKVSNANLKSVHINCTDYYYDQDDHGSSIVLYEHKRVFGRYTYLKASPYRTDDVLYEHDNRFYMVVED